jgi:hypothetical protein
MGHGVTGPRGPLVRGDADPASQFALWLEVSRSKEAIRALGIWFFHVVHRGARTSEAGRLGDHPGGQPAVAGCAYEVYMDLPMVARSIQLFLVPVGALVLTACATPKEIFLHKGHREAYAIQPEEMKDLQFYLSTSILAQERSSSHQAVTPESVVRVEEGTPGLATGAGPDWIRVSFEEGRQGATFIAVATETQESAYWLATEVEGEPGRHTLKDLPEKILLHEGRNFRLLYGSHAHLLVDTRDLEKLIASRRHVTGRTKSGD